MFELDLSIDRARHLIAAATFAASRSNSPILETIRVEPGDGDSVQILATDRFALFRAVLDGDEIDEERNVTEGIAFPAKEFAAAVADACKVRMGRVRVTSDGENWTITGENGSRSGRTVAGNFPPVARLIPTQVQPIPMIAVQAAYLARLDKVRTALKAPADAGWTLASAPRSGTKYAPIVASMGIMTVLIQPLHRSDIVEGFAYGSNIDTSAAEPFAASTDAEVRDAGREAGALAILRAIRAAADEGRDLIDAARLAAYGLADADRVTEALPFTLKSS